MDTSHWNSNGPQYKRANAGSPREKGAMMDMERMIDEEATERLTRYTVKYFQLLPTLFSCSSELQTRPLMGVSGFACPDSKGFSAVIGFHQLVFTEGVPCSEF